MFFFGLDPFLAKLVRQIRKIFGDNVPVDLRPADHGIGTARARSGEPQKRFSNLPAGPRTGHHYAQRPS